MSTDALSSSRALWNRTGLDLRSDEILAQLLDRGEMAAWRELYALARTDRDLRARMLRLIRTVPLPMPHFWLAALVSRGEEINLSEPVPEYPGPGI